MKIINKIKELWDNVKAKAKEIYTATEKWVGVFVHEYKPEFLVLGVTGFAFIVDMFAGSRFGAFFAIVLIGFLARSVVLQKKQNDRVKELEAVLAGPQYRKPKAKK